MRMYDTSNLVFYGIFVPPASILTIYFPARRFVQFFSFLTFKARSALVGGMIYLRHESTRIAHRAAHGISEIATAAVAPIIAAYFRRVVRFNGIPVQEIMPSLRRSPGMRGASACRAGGLPGRRRSEGRPSRGETTRNRDSVDFSSKSTASGK